MDIKIYNGFGQIVFSSSPQNKKFNVNISDFSSGVYFVKIKTIRENIVREIAIY